MKKLFASILLSVLLVQTAFAEGYYYFYDHLGNVDVVTDDSGEPVATYEYDPFGNTIEENIYDEDFENDYKYTGQEEDDETGLYYYNARYYSPGLGRFVSQDPAVYDDRLFKMLGDPQSLNPYSYARNNPISYTDANGEEPVKAQAGNLDDLLNVVKGITNMPYSYSSNVGNSRMTDNLLSYYQNDIKGESIRYIYTEKAGWIDMRHFMYFADKAYHTSEITSMLGGYASEIYQWLGFDKDGSDINSGNNISAFSYEDLASDYYGALFGDSLKLAESDNNSDAYQLLLNFLSSLGATNPEEAYNYNEMPYDSTEAGQKEYTDVDKSYVP